VNTLRAREVWLGLALLASLDGCTGDCILPSCPPIAIDLNIVSSTSGDPIDNASLQVAGAASSSQGCPGTCDVIGGPGTYQLTVSAPGFDRVERAVTVSPVEPARCDCGGFVNTEHVTIALTPITP
jgi:hypothetical protein